MKILYLGTDRSDAQAVAGALRGVNRDVTMAHAVNVDDATKCLDEHRDVSALVVDARTFGDNWPSVLTHARALSLRPAVIVIVPEETAFEALHPDADDYIPRNASLNADLPGVVKRALAHAREHERADLQRRLADATKALEDAERRHEAAIVTLEGRLSDQQAQYEIAMARAAATWDMVDEQLRVAAMEVERARHSQAEAAAEVERLTRRDADLTTQLAEAAAARTALERRVADVEAAADGARTQAERDRIAAAERAAQREHELESRIASETDQRQGVEAQLAHALSAAADAEAQHSAAISEAAAQSRELEAALRLARMDAESKAVELDRLATRAAELDTALADVSASRSDLERKLAATEAAFDDATTRATRERLAASKRAADREAELDGQIRQERSIRATLEETIAQTEAALRDAQQQHEAALAAAAQDRAALDAQFAHELSQLTAERDEIARRLQETEAALDRAAQDYQSANASIERLTQRQAELTSELADVQATRHTLELQLADAETAIHRSSAREADLDTQLQQERAARAALEHTVADGEAALRDAHQRHADVEAVRDDLERQLAETRTTLTDAEERATRERAAAHDRQADVEARLAHEVAARTVLEQTLADTQAAAANAERAHHDEAAALRAQAVEQKARFDVQLAQEQLEHEHRLADAGNRADRLTIERDALQQSLATETSLAQQLQERLTATARELVTAKADADRVPELQKANETLRAENNRLFDQAGLAMVRCSRDGALIQANRASAVLLGRRTLDDVRGAQFAFAVFEAPNVLAWLIEQCAGARVKESVETTWRRKDGGRVFVRLSARLVAPEVIEIVAEDITRIRVLQERLGQAHRMEAVGRFASEVAATCSTLLDAIYQKGREWLATTAGSTESRREGELLLDEIGRAAGLVRQLGACGDEQARTPMLVDLNTLMRDLEPVLGRVAGGDVDIRLRETSSPLNVDLATEQIERLLVNIAGYARERMPSGGQLRIELGTVVVNRRFADRHPNVRLGLHALITVTEIRRATSAPGSRNSLAAVPSHRAPVRTSSRPGFDFGTIQELVSECGGHLWIKVQPQGEMVAKIRLPLVSSYAQAQPRPVAVRASRERLAVRWLKS